MRRLVLTAVVLAIATPARADVDLRVRRAPTKVSIAMRAEAGSPAASPSPSASTAAPSPPATVSIAMDRGPRADSLMPTLERAVILHAQLGYAVDQGDTPDATLVNPQHRDTRLYGFGDAVLGTNGVLLPSLSTYFAARFRLEQSPIETSSSNPTVYDALGDRGDLLVRSAYVEVDAPADGMWKPLRLRAGRQFRQGVGLIHFDGLIAAYETPSLDASLLAGRRVALYAASTGFLAAGGDPEVLGGGSLRLRLGRLANVPITLLGDWLTLRDEDHLVLGARVEPTRELAVTTSVRLRDGNIARADANVQLALGSRTVLRLDADERLEDDWVYDMVLGTDDSSDNPARRFLRLGPPLRRSRLTARAGTVLRENLDLNAFGTGAWERDPDVDAPFSPTYLEYGGAVEARFRGGLAAGVELSTRQYERPALTVRPQPGHPAALDDSAAWGERAFEGALVEIRYSLGPRRLSGELQGYTRRYEVVSPAIPDGIMQVRTGGRFRLEGWIDRRFRLLAEYEVTGTLAGVAPELAGLQSLRFLGEAAF